MTDAPKDVPAVAEEPLPLHLMIDIETLDTQPTALVLSAGWAWFDEDRIHSSGKVHFDHQLQQGQDRTISVDTVHWWKEQNQPLPASKHGFDVRMLAPEMMRTNPRIYASGPQKNLMEGVLVWANSPSFDCVILRNWATRLRVDLPWKFWHERDFRTHKYLVEQVFNNSNDPDKVMQVRFGASHDAEQDARDQAQFMINNKHLVRF